MIDNKLPSIRTISQARFSPYKMVFYENNIINHVMPSSERLYGTDLPRQRLPRTYELNGNVDAFYVSTYLIENSFFPEGTGGYLEEQPTLDIDTAADLTLVKSKVK